MAERGGDEKHNFTIRKASLWKTVSRFSGRDADRFSKRYRLCRNRLYLFYWQPISFLPECYRLRLNVLGNLYPYYSPLSCVLYFSMCLRMNARLPFAFTFYRLPSPFRPRIYMWIKKHGESKTSGEGKNGQCFHLLRY